MSSTAWFPFYPADYVADTRRLSATEHGAYLLLLIEQWQHGDLPDDDHDLAKIVGMRIDHWKRIAPRIRTYFVAGDAPGTIRQKRLHAERVKAIGLVAKRTKAANARWTNGATVQNQNSSTSDEANSLENNTTRDAHADADQPVCKRQPEPQPQKDREGLRPSNAADLFAGTPPEPAEPKAKPRAKRQPGPNDEMLDSCAAKLADLTGKPAKSFFSMLNRWIADTGGDVQAVRRYVEEAAAQQQPDPVRVITSRVKHYSKQAEGPVPDIAGGEKVRDIVQRCEDITEVCWSGLPGHEDFERVIAGALAAGANPEAHIYPVMRDAKRLGWPAVKTSGFFRHGIWSLMPKEAA